MRTQPLTGGGTLLDAGTGRASCELEQSWRVTHRIAPKGLTGGEGSPPAALQGILCAGPVTCCGPWTFWKAPWARHSCLPLTGKQRLREVV